MPNSCDTFQKKVNIMIIGPWVFNENELEIGDLPGPQLEKSRHVHRILPRKLRRVFNVVPKISSKAYHF